MNARSNNLSRNGATLAMACCLACLASSTAHAQKLRPPCHRKQVLAAHADDRVLIKMKRSDASRMKTKGVGSTLPGIVDLRPFTRQHVKAARAIDIPEWHVAKLEAGATVEQVLETLSQHEDVAQIEPDYLISTPQPIRGQSFSPMATGADPGMSEQYAIAKLALTQAWTRQAGSRSVVVAVIDTGVKLDHPELVGQLWRNTAEEPNGADDDGNGLIDDLFGWNFADNNNNTLDAQGHGTHVAGIIAATRNNAIGIAGAANVSIMPVKVLGEDGRGSTSGVMEGVVYAVNHGASIINMSLGSGDFSQAFSELCDEAAQADVLIFAASGNESATSVSFPAGYPSVVAVGATDAQDQLASFSNTGPDIEIVTPGVEILSTFPGPSFEFLSGTSMACPYACGVAALVRSAFPSMSAAAVRARLNGTADDLGPAGYDLQSGFGRLNAFRALTESLDATLPDEGGQTRDDDIMEENDSANEARELTGGNFNLVGLDEDWFTIRLTAKSELTVSMRGSEGDMDMALFDSVTGEKVLQSAGDGSNESIKITAEAGEYVLLVLPYQSQFGAYSLSINIVGKGEQKINPDINIVCGQASPLPMMGLMLGLVGMGGSIRRRSQEDRR